jgi:hypothetical protein
MVVRSGTGAGGAAMPRTVGKVTVSGILKGGGLLWEWSRNEEGL